MLTMLSCIIRRGSGLFVSWLLLTELHVVTAAKEVKHVSSMGAFDIRSKLLFNNVRGGRSLNLSDFVFISLSSRFAFLLSLYSCRGDLSGNGQFLCGVNVPSVPSSELSLPQGGDKKRKEIASISRKGAYKVSRNVLKH